MMLGLAYVLSTPALAETHVYVSVAADSCADANAASTAAVIRGREALGWLAKLGLPARLVDVTGVVFTVAGWPSDSEPGDSEPVQK